MKQLIIDEIINILSKKFYAIIFKKRKFVTIDVNFQLNDELSYYVKKKTFLNFVYLTIARKKN